MLIFFAKKQTCPLCNLLIVSYTADPTVSFSVCSSQSLQADDSSGPAEIKISSKFLIIEEKHVSSLLLVGSTLLTASLRDAAWTLTLYRWTAQSACSSLELLSSFSLPLAAGLLCTDGAMRETIRPVLVCVRSSDAEPPLRTGHLSLQPTLFKLLFGIDAALTKSPVVLCGLPDGRLYHLPLHLPASRLRILHSLEQPLVLLGSSSAEDTGAGGASTLVAVGKMGRVVLIRAESAAPGKVNCSTSFTETRVPGPVICGCTHRNFLYYSTGSDLLRLEVSVVGKEDPDKHNENYTDCFLQNPVSLNVCRVVALAEASSSAAGERDQTRQPLVISSDLLSLICRRKNKCVA